MGLVFGPVPSRRLGRSLGINNIPPKECSYACIYCQLGNTIKLGIDRRRFYTTEQIADAVEKKLKSITSSEDGIDFLTFVPDGEPTLDLLLGENIKVLKKFNIKIAVITNSSLIADKSVRENLYKADWVSLKIDTLNENTWHKIDRPHGKIDFVSMLNGIKLFSKNYKNFLATETMLVSNFNDTEKELKKIALFIKQLNSDKTYISVPTRPPAVLNVVSPTPDKINKAYQIFKSQDLDVELITDYEGNEFSSTGNFENDILNITSVHPMRREAVENLIKKDKATWKDIENLIEIGELVETKYNSNTYYLRNLRKWRKKLN